MSKLFKDSADSKSVENPPEKTFCQSGALPSSGHQGKESISETSVASASSGDQDIAPAPANNIYRARRVYPLDIATKADEFAAIAEAIVLINTAPTLSGFEFLMEFIAWRFPERFFPAIALIHNEESERE
jgi:hypothetical protein